MPEGLSIIIVNYKSVSLILDCLHSFVHHITIQNWEVIVVDNGSGDDSGNLIKKAFPAVKYIQLGYNAGFARANNKGTQQSAFATVLLLNADTLIENNAITTCYETFIRSNFAGCGIQLLNFDRSYQTSGSYVMKGGLNYLLLLPFVGADNVTIFADFESLLLVVFTCAATT